VRATRRDIRRIIDRLVEERQSLRATSADAATLHANREALAYWQRELSRNAGTRSGRGAVGRMNS
jgi:hypothetical protein